MNPLASCVDKAPWAKSSLRIARDGLIHASNAKTLHQLQKQSRTKRDIPNTFLISEGLALGLRARADSPSQVYERSHPSRHWSSELGNVPKKDSGGAQLIWKNKYTNVREGPPAGNQSSGWIFHPAFGNSAAIIYLPSTESKTNSMEGT